MEKEKQPQDLGSPYPIEAKDPYREVKTLRKRIPMVELGI